MQAFVDLVKSGWSVDKRAVPIRARPYFKVRDEMVIEGGVLYKEERCVIPSALRREMVQRVHEGHMGVEGCLGRARESIFWPGMNNQVRNFVRQRNTCQTFGRKQQKETIIPHVVDQQWIKAGADLFNFDGRDYLITVDYFSNYWEVDYLAGYRSS